MQAELIAAKSRPKVRNQTKVANPARTETIYFIWAWNTWNLYWSRRGNKDGYTSPEAAHDAALKVLDSVWSDVQIEKLTLSSVPKG